MGNDDEYTGEEMLKDIGDIVDAATSKEELLYGLKEVNKTLKESKND